MGRKLDPELERAILANPATSVTGVRLDRLPAGGPRRHKYGARPTVVGGVRFDSAKEARRWGVLCVRAAAGLITGLERQPRFALVVNGRHVGDYVADARYVEDGRVVVEDTKGVRTAVYRLKRKMVEAQYGITIREV